MDINNLSQDEKERLVEQLWDLIQQRLTTEPTKTYLSELGTGKEKVVEIETNGGEISVDNPFKVPVEGYSIILGDKNSSLQLKNNSHKNLVFDTSSMGIGNKVKVLLTPQTKSDTIGG